MKIPAPNAGRDKLMARLGGLLAVLGIVLGIVGYFQSHNTDNSLSQNDALVLAVIGLSCAIVGSAVFVRYLNASGQYATASADNDVTGDQYGIAEYGLDATSMGVLTSTKAAGLAAGALKKGKARLGWTAGITPNPWQLTTPGGTPVPWWYPKAQQMVRMHGVLNDQGQPLPYVDFVIGKTTHASGVLSIEPVGLAARTLTSVLAQAIGLAS